MLLGAPALVLAVDRHASLALEITNADGWNIQSNVLPHSNVSTLTELIHSNTHPLISELLSVLPNHDSLPRNARLSLDTTECFLEDQKLGVGSSAAILVSCAQVLSYLTHHELVDATLIEVHNKLQANLGSGLDVAASRHGGLIRFQEGRTIRVDFPSGLHLTFVFSGKSTPTTDMVRKFRALADELPSSFLQSWTHLATDVADAIDDLSKFLDLLVQLNELVFQFDQSKHLGIYSPAHKMAMKIAQNLGIVYKPSGAGGGDIGVALSEDREKLKEFERKIERYQLKPLNLAMAKDGATLEL